MDLKNVFFINIILEWRGGNGGKEGVVKLSFNFSKKVIIKLDNVLKSTFYFTIFKFSRRY